MPPDFGNRSYQKELLDEEQIPIQDLHLNLHELDVINKLLGGYNITFKGLKKIVKDGDHLVDIGSGGGDTLLQIVKWARRKKINLQLTGVDYKVEAIEYARARCKDFPEIQFIHADYRAVQFEQPVDIIHSCLFCHHLNDEELTDFLKWMDATANKAFLINDLERNPIAHYSIKFLTRLFSKSYLVKNDAPLSVLRGFKKEELNNYAERAGVKDLNVKWMWAFRYLVMKEHAV